MRGPLKDKSQITNLVNIQNLASGLLHLAHLVHEVPKSGLGHDLVASKKLHSVSRRVLVGGSRSLAADHLVQFHLKTRKEEMNQVSKTELY